MYSQQNNIVGKVFQCFLNVRNTSKKYPFNVNDYDGFIDYKIEMDYFTFKQIKTIQVIQVVNSNQIKLADGSNTTFDSNNKDIRFNKGGQVDELVENVSTEYLNSIRNQDKSRWNYDLEKSIEKQGILEPVTIGYWSEYDKVTLIDGHHRLDTAIDLDIKSIPTIIQLYYNNPTGQHRLYSAPKYNPNAKKPSDLGIFKKGGLIAPNGKQSNLTDSQYKLVRTPAFKEWFGDWEYDPSEASKVVDENGEPLVVYHGTNRDFNVFDERTIGSANDRGFYGKGFYFTDNLISVKQYGNVIKSYFLKVTNPVFTYDSPREFSKSIWIPKGAKNLIGQGLEPYEHNEWNFYLDDNFSEKVTKNIIANGRDGLIAENVGEYIVYEPNQIKLADGTNTTFDSNNNDIRFDNGGQVDEYAQQLIDIISMNPQLEKYEKYKVILKDKFGINFDDFYKDNYYIENANLSEIKVKNDFLNYDKYIEYAIKIFRLRGLINDYHAQNIEGIISKEKAIEIGEKLNFIVKHREYDGGSGNYAEHSIDTITIPNKVDINSFIHEIGHHYDHFESQEYNGLAKTSTYASSLYEIGKSDEVFAENFKNYFIAPNWLKEKLPMVYNELDKNINDVYKKEIYKLIDSSKEKYKKGGMTNKGYVSYKDKYNTKYGYSKGESHDLEEISKDTGVSIKGLQQIYNKGIGAYKTNPSSVRPNVNSKEQWAMARVYSSVMGGKASKIDSNELKMERGGILQDKNSIRKYAENLLKDFDYKYTGYSESNYGNSMYFDVDGIKCRFSDHTLTNRDRMINEINFSINDVNSESTKFSNNQSLLKLKYRLGDKSISYGKISYLGRSGRYLDAFGYTDLKDSKMEQGGNIKNNNMSKHKDGLFVGKSHKEGGIPMVVKSTGQKIEVEGGESITNKTSMADDKIRTLTGTNCEIISQINTQNGNGVAMDCDSVVGKKYEYKDGGQVNLFDGEKDLIDKRISGLKIALKFASNEEKKLIQKRIKAFEIAKKMLIPNTKSDVKTMELYVSPMRERNLDKYGEDTNQCISCGKLMKDSDRKYVCMGTDWEAYNTNEFEERDGINYFVGTDTEIQGFFPIGNDCAKKMKGFTFERENKIDTGGIDNLELLKNKIRNISKKMEYDGESGYGGYVIYLDKDKIQISTYTNLSPYSAQASDEVKVV